MTCQAVWNTYITASKKIRKILKPRIFDKELIKI